MTSKEHKNFVEKKFDRIVRRYELVNSLASFWIDRHWRKILIKRLEGLDGPLLDLCCGPFTLSLEILKKRQENIFGLDLSREMLQFGLTKKTPFLRHIFPLRGDAERLPLKSDYFGIITIAFGFRNLPNREDALNEFHRVLKRGGNLFILDFSLPRNCFIRRIYLLYLTKYIPILGGLLTGDKEAYCYLGESIQKFPPQEKIVKMAEERGFKTMRVEEFTFGIVTLYHFLKT